MTPQLFRLIGHHHIGFGKHLTRRPVPQVLHTFGYNGLYLFRIVILTLSDDDRVVHLQTPYLAIEFDEAWKNREAVQIDDLKIRFISRSDLIQAKEASGRPQDKIDLERLKIAEQLDSPNKP